MVSPTSTYKGLSLPVTGSEPGTWGDDVTNNTFVPIDKMLGGPYVIALTNSNVLLTTSQAQNCIFRLTGTLTGAVQITSPANGFCFVENQTSGAFAVTWYNGVGTPYTIPQGASAVLIADTTYGVRSVQAPLQSNSTTVGNVNITGTLGVAGKTSLTSTDSMALPNGTTAQRNPTPSAGDMRYNSTTKAVEVSNGSNWSQISSLIVPPQGRLTPVTGVPVITSDVTASTLYYTNYNGNIICVFDGSDWIPVQFNSDIPVALTAAASANSLIDIFATLSSGVLVLGFGPVWTTTTPGSGSRGTGAGTTQLSRQNGVLTNAVTISLVNGANTYSSIPAGQATYLASAWIDAIAGQTTCHITWGQSRKWGVWNAYNRANISLKSGDNTASWTYGTASWRPSNNNTANSLSVFSGLPEEGYVSEFSQRIQTGSAGYQTQIGIGINSTSSASDFITLSYYGTLVGSTVVAKTVQAPITGLSTVTALENSVSGNTSTYFGTNANMLLTASYRG